MKTNRRVKRVKTTRRNRRSRRTQRGGGKFGDSIKLYESKLRECKQKCDTDNTDPITRYTVDRPTQSGWYITYEPPYPGYSPTYEIKNTSIGVGINSYNKSYQDYLDMLEELPDPRKEYTTSIFLTKNKWKLTYDSPSERLQWVNQTDNTTQPFIIQTPLKIGDKTATQ